MQLVVLHSIVIINFKNGTQNYTLYKRQGGRACIGNQAGKHKVQLQGI